ncbi:MAG: hypothetical protein KME64_30430 [Scytonematopsis contorta HA4267-MV1]|jgi:hypothetical protein|nr:hypothetical protein [Scytonematopsis contorta HA4267-MV1]
MKRKSHKLKVALLLTSTTVLAPKTAYGETIGNDLDVVSKDNNAKSQLPLAKDIDVTNDSLEDDLVSISQPESVNTPELGNQTQEIKLNTLNPNQQVTKNQYNCNPSFIKDIEFTNPDFLIPESTVDAEFTKLFSSEMEVKNQEYCQPDNVAKPEFASPQIQQNFSLNREGGKQTFSISNSQPEFTATGVNRQLAEEKLVDNNVQDSNFIKPPTVAVNQKVNPFTTTFPLNGMTVNHLKESELSVETNFGDEINTTFDYNGLFKIDNQIRESLTKDNIFTLEQTGSYIQLQTIRTRNEVTLTTKEPQTLLGTEIQLSLTASCLFGTGNSNQQCTYTPGLFTDKDSIDPDTLLPRRIIQTSNVGDILTPESIAAIREPGFQSGANGQNVGVDIFFSNSGGFFGNNQSSRSSVRREENNRNSPAGFYSTVRQIVRANDKEAVIGRTVRGFGFIANDKNALLNSAVQLSGLILPDMVPEIEGSGNPVNTNINQNLFLAANNVRLPANSFTFYHGGVGRAQTPLSGGSLNQLPPGIFDSVWIGVSPVTKRSLSNSSRYETIGSRQVLASAGGEGGVESNVNLTSLVNGQAFSNSNLDNFYGQVYLTMFNQEANFISTSKYTEDINYYPHISISGNITGYNDVWRYYGGIIGGEKLNAYIGTDYTKNTLNGWNYSVGGIFYTNPDTDYYSQVQGSVSKTFTLGGNNNLVLSSGLNYALNRKMEIGGTIFDSPASSVTLGARANLGSFSLGLVNYFDGILPNSIGNTLLADLTIKFSENFILSAYYTPINENSSRSRYGVQAQFKFGDNDKSSSLNLSWTNNEYDFGSDPGGNKLDVSNNVFKVLFKSSL